MLLKYFMSTSLLLFLLGLILFVVSIVSPLSIWWGISFIKGSFYLLLIGLFLYLIEFEFTIYKKKA